MTKAFNYGPPEVTRIVSLLHCPCCGCAEDGSPRQPPPPDTPGVWGEICLSCGMAMAGAHEQSPDE